MKPVQTSVDANMTADASAAAIQTPAEAAAAAAASELSAAASELSAVASVAASEFSTVASAAASEFSTVASAAASEFSTAASAAASEFHAAAAVAADLTNNAKTAVHTHAAAPAAAGTLPGVLLCLAIAAPAWYLGLRLPIIGGPVFGILLGMLLGATALSGVRSASASAGIKFTSKKILQYSIILLGFEMNLFNVIKVGSQSLMVMLFTLSASFLTAWIAGRALKIDGGTMTLIGVGTCICGGSAIAATAPVIRASDEDVAQAISTIFLFNIAAVFLFPALGHALGLTDIGFGMWAGTAINDTSSVVAAGASWSSAAGNNIALDFATIVKLTRTLMIVPITLILAIYTAGKAKKAAAASAADGAAAGCEGADSQMAENTFSFARVFPWFVLGFIATAIINTFAGIPVEFSHGLATFGKFLIVMAMVAIGLNTDLKKLFTNGLRPIVLGLCCWFAVASASLIVQHFMGTL
ncbi:YeiH family protein [Bacilliculturomica massiliensis]|uniref:YeiH family protein n=1 Tax=Bacilliculturomica massiliensis TaxID=1917867 RepID=UPI002ED43DDD